MTPEAATAREHARRLILGPPQLGVRRSDHEFEAARSAGCRSRLPSARMFASIPLNTRNRPASVAFSSIDLAMLLGVRRHADPTRDWKAVPVIGDAQTGVAKLHARRRHRGDALAAVTPGRVHLKIAAVVFSADNASIEMRCQRAAASRSGSGKRLDIAGADVSCEVSWTFAIAPSTVGDRPCSTTSEMIRALAGPTNSILAQRARLRQGRRPTRADR